MAWSNHVIGENKSSAHAKVESITSIPSSTHTQVYMVVKRTINSATVRYVEYLDRFYDSGELDFQDAHYVVRIYYNSSSATTISGLTHLEGETVRNG